MPLGVPLPITAVTSRRALRVTAVLLVVMIKAVRLEGASTVAADKVGPGRHRISSRKQGLTFETDGGRICEANEETACLLLKAVKKMQKKKSPGSGTTTNARNGHSPLPLMAHFQLGVDTIESTAANRPAEPTMPAASLYTRVPVSAPNP